MPHGVKGLLDVKENSKGNFISVEGFENSLGVVGELVDS